MLLEESEVLDGDFRELDVLELESYDSTAIVKVEDLNFISKSFLDCIQAPIPKEWLKQRKIRGGDIYWYLPVEKVIRLLNKASGFLWSFTIIDKEIDYDNYQAWVHGRLTVQILTSHGFVEISKDNFGGGSLFVYRYDSPKGDYKAGDIIDLADDLKSATSDCIKKCASMFGLAIELYEKGKSKVIGDEEITSLYRKGKMKGLSEEQVKELCVKTLKKNVEDLEKEDFAIFSKFLINYKGGESLS